MVSPGNKEILLTSATVYWVLDLIVKASSLFEEGFFRQRKRQYKIKEQTGCRQWRHTENNIPSSISGQRSMYEQKSHVEVAYR